MIGRAWIAAAALALVSACGHVSDQAIVDNCRAGGGLAVSTCECVRSEMKIRMNDYAYDSIVLLANGRDQEAGARLDGLTERDQISVAATMMSAYSMCAGAGGEAAR